ncbi:class III extradiol dioxygenase subunit beta [Pseudonocardia sp. GCM10023141]|uniref:class III extradiol dioxygenase subunit beta n=1 Tax=Pseudonocardia sp. GCM10023141 TaxID=3252653 RepID=UPI00361F09C4
MAELIAGVGVSHIPALGVAMEGDGSGPAAVVHEKFAPVRQWVRDLELDTVIVIYNDHASAFSLELLPTFAIGAAESYAPADEGYGARDVPVVRGDANLSWHLIDSVIPAGFDLAVAQKLDVDHGLTVPLTVLFGSPDEWPVTVVPIEVNVVQQPTPSAQRCFDLGRAIGRAVASYPGGSRIGIVGTGGMSHQLQGRRAGHINTVFDQMFLSAIVDKPQALTELTNTDYIREAGSEGAELVMWLVMRGALGDDVSCVHSGYHVPVSNTAAGLVAIDNRGSSR